MEKTVEICKLVVFAFLTVIGILCLSYSNVYGLPAMNFQPNAQGSTPGAPGPTTPGTDDPGVLYELLPDVYPSDITSGEIPEDDPGTVPEPTTLILLGAGLASLRLLKRKN